MSHPQGNRVYITVYYPPKVASISCSWAGSETEEVAPSAQPVAVAAVAAIAAPVAQAPAPAPAPAPAANSLIGDLLMDTPVAQPGFAFGAPAPAAPAPGTCQMFIAFIVSFYVTPRISLTKQNKESQMLLPYCQWYLFLLF